MRAISIGIPFIRRRSGVPIDAQAQAHFNRVIADGGVVPSGLSGVNAFFSAVKAIYGTSDINTAISAAYDPHYLGYRLGAGSGTTLGQAARTLYAPKGIFGGIGTGSAYWEGVGVTGNFVSTPDSAANNNNGNKQIDIKFSTNVTSGSSDFVSKDNVGANRAYAITYDHSNQRFSIIITTDLTATKVVNTDIGTILRNYAGTYRVTFVFSGGILTIRTFQSLDGITFTEVGTAKTENGNNFIGTNAILNIGTRSVSSGSCSANIFRLTIANSIGGTPVVDFNANQYTGANTWTSTTGEVWTVNSTGAGLADVTQTTAASQPLLLAHTGENYWFGSGVAGNFVSTPNAAANQITGDIEIIGKRVKIKDYTGTYAIASKGDQASNRGWVLRSSAGTLVFLFSQSGTGMISTVASVSLTAAGYTADTEYYFKVTRISSSGVVQFYGSIDGVNYTQIGSNVTASSGALFNSTGQVCVGTWNNDSNHFLGSIGGVTISNSIGGAPVVDFNPSSYNPSTSQTQWVSTTGETWTLNVGTATSGYKGVLVDRTIMQGDGVDDLMQSGTIATQSVCTNYLSVNPLNLNASKYYLGSSIVDVNIIYSTGGGSTRFGNASPYSEITFVNVVANRLSLLTAVGNTSSSLVFSNNANQVTGTVGAATFSNIRLFAPNTPSLLGNAIINILVISSNANNLTQRTAMYNYLRSLNNNAF